MAEAKNHLNPILPDSSINRIKVHMIYFNFSEIKNLWHKELNINKIHTCAAHRRSGVD